MSRLSQVDVKDGVAAGTKICCQHVQPSRVWKVRACVRDGLSNFYFGDAYI